MKKLLLLLLILAACSPVTEKIFVANEDSGSISVIDAVSLKEIDRVSLTMDHEGARVEYGPHNVQVSGDKVLITANTAHKEHAEADASAEHTHASPMPTISFGVLAVEAHGDEPDEGIHADHSDQLIIMDAKSHKITQRIDLDVGAHLAHVVSDGLYAYITSTDKEVLYVVNLNTGGASFIALPKGSMPHGVRLTDDQKTAAIAGMNGSLILVDLVSKNIKNYDLNGKGVQTGVAGDIIVASVYDTKQLAILENDNLTFVSLVGAKGPIQMYSTPDNRFVYIADQGVYFDQPAGSKTYKVDLNSKEVVATIETGFAPHGVVVSPDGRVWVTNLRGNSVSVLQNDLKVAEIPVGASPNGVSYWFAR